MIKTDELISEAMSLPIDIKTQLINRLLVSLNPERKNIDEFWMKEAEKRLKDIKTGKIKTVPGEQIFQEIKERFQK